MEEAGLFILKSVFLPAGLADRARLPSLADELQDRN
jgi:hypothetical protein